MTDKYIGRPCKVCGNTERYVSNRGCTKRAQHPEYVEMKKQYYLENKAEYRARARAAYAKDPSKAKAKSVLRQVSKIQRTPAWADQDKITEFYRNCPEGYHVDHIVPLRGKNVSGLHVHTNLQYLTAEENLKKSNSWEG